MGGDLAWKAFFDGSIVDDKIPLGLSMYDRRDVIWQLASALQYLGKFDLLHRDLHLQNVFVSHSRGRYRISIGDLGMMSFRSQEVVFVPDSEENWKLRDWVPCEAWNILGKSSKSGGRTASPSLVRRAPTPGRVDGQYNWQASDIFSLGVMHLYLCFGQIESRVILQKVRQGRYDLATLAEACASDQMILEPKFAIRMVAKDPDERPMPAEIMNLVKHGPVSTMRHWLCGSCSNRAPRSRSPRRRRNA